MIQSLLIANRGEIACRIIRTARAMGIRTVAVYSDADAHALHVRQADEAVHIGPSPARESYLVGEKIIAAAKATGAAAIHPGYGFLSENADFAQAVIDAGLVWVGPKPDSIRAMGLKDAAKERMIAAGVPVTPGYLGADQSPDRLAEEAAKVGYPVLIKAVAGGGGKGMRRVDNPADFADALLSCQREAASSFGNAQVLIEKYILSPRHIEVQVFGDTHGTVVHLFERDCSLQRRHQKVIEEAPAPGMDPETREAICAAAVRAARAVDYVGAGTIEFIADASEGLRADRIWFMEMNTRLQVEHPVTEEITGVDLVEWQLRVASGEALPKRQDELSINGWAMEARLYAEDPANGFLPSVGRLDLLNLPDHVSGCSVRVETGVQEKDEISSFYDPMIAKLITRGPDRISALELLADACEWVSCYPVKTNAWFIVRICDDEDFAAGRVTTAFIDQNARVLTATPVASSLLRQEAAQQFIQSRWANPTEYHHRSLRTDRGLSGFRLNADHNFRVNLLENGKPISVDFDIALYDGGTNWEPSKGGSFDEIDAREVLYVEGGAPFDYRLERRVATGASAADGAILSPMPGRIIAVEVAAGDTVTKGQKLVTLEAMKMEHSLTAPFDGTIAEVNAEIGGQVQEGVVLVRLDTGA
ncbi:acetyl/propionyl/methylcrotonyl-CoA carboxylase subunit alpha [Sphingomonas sp. TF3]|uniref:acetyl/propionyl/methylcrotonyl-CoA carboxylase subunit alpha n=1 Tax=Sphingomonas sp. TF3 TaxID=2495580 RepID=UPI000F88B2ED|nr:acetyl/propionyl/methylcrotonyl-CoA carboxylase subunit alpha [Sphingomonas sp. TF3]RUN78234.1 acetyl/propionyl/methylcrotonyl-CoA carboxylase subunit alpha [Sphingomonas sp. TF3]